MVIQRHDYRKENPDTLEAEALAAAIEETAARQTALQRISTEAMIEALYTLYRQWAVPSHPMYHRFRHVGLAYLLSFLHPDFVRSFLRRGLRHEQVLDRVVDAGGFTGLAVPKGVVGHWVAGNVPLLSIISLLQALLTRNVSIVKLSSKQENFITPFLHSLAQTGETGQAMANAVLVLSYSGERADLNRIVASYCDVRIAWGGAEAVQAVAGLPGKIHSTTLVFGPKYSCAAIDPARMTSGDWTKLAQDIVLFNQLACTSPHAVFIKGGPADVPAAAERLAEALRIQQTKPYFGQLDAGETGKVLHYRTIARMKGERLLCSGGAEWTIHLHEAQGPLAGTGMQVVHLYPLQEVPDLVAWLPTSIQTIAHRLSSEEATDLALAARHTGLSRIVPVGAPHAYDIPWDGMLVLDQLVRWIRVQT